MHNCNPWADMISFITGNINCICIYVSTQIFYMFFLSSSFITSGQCYCPIFIISFEIGRLNEVTEFGAKLLL